MSRRSGSFIPGVVLRFLGAVLAVSGGLLVASVGLTLIWQEPVSAFLAAREQTVLEQELGEVTDGASASSAGGVGTRGKPAPRRRGARRAAMRRSAASHRRVTVGRAAGRLVLPSLGRDDVFVEGTDTASLRRGPGHLSDTPLPGEGGTVGFGGHRTTYGAPFRNIDRLAPGDPIHVEMPYGRFTYRVRRARIVRPDAVWVKRPVRGEQIILIACHPLYSAARRIVVFADRQAG